MVNSRPPHQVDWFLLRGCHVLGFPLILFYFKCRGSFFKKVFIEVVTVLLLLFLFQLWGRKVCGGLSSLSRNRTCTSCMEGKVLTTGLPEKSPCSFYMVTIPSSILRERKKIDKVQEVERRKYPLPTAPPLRQRSAAISQSISMTASGPFIKMWD